MMDEFLYFLTDDQGRSYYTSGERVDVSSTPVPLKNTPSGWDEKSIKWTRSFSKPGVVRAFTLPLKAVKDAATIVRQLFYTGFVQAALNLVILKRDLITNVFDAYFVGAVDSSQYRGFTDGANMQVMEGGLSQLVKASEDTTYEIPLNVPEAVNINFDGVEMLSEVRTLNYKDYIQSGDIFTPNVRHSRYTNVGIIITGTETQYPSIVWNQNTQYQDSNNSDIADAFKDQWLFKANDNANLNIKSGILSISVAGAIRVSVKFYLKNEVTNTNRAIVLFSQPSDGFPHNLDIDISGSYNINANERGWLYVDMEYTGDGHSISFAWPPFEDSEGTHEIIFSYNYRKPATVVKGLRPAYVFAQLIDKITDGKYSTKSDFLEEVSSFVLTSGDGLRGFEDAVIKTSLNDFLKSYNTRFCADFGISTNEVPQRALFERNRYFFNDSYLVDLGEVNKLEDVPALDYVYTDYKIGYQDQNYNDINGRYEFNTTSEWKGPVTRITAKTFELISPYRADCIGAEITRINLSNKSTTDSSSDNDTWFINIETTLVNGLYNLNRPDVDTITGVPSPATVFNTLMTPAQCLRAHGAIIRGGNFRLESQYLNFQTSPKNKDFSITVGGVKITEKDNIQIGVLEAPYFIPIMFTYSTEVPLNIKTLIETDPYGKMKIVWKGATLYGYMFEASQKPFLNEAQAFKMLCAAETDVLQLINV